MNKQEKNSVANMNDSRTIEILSPNHQLSEALKAVETLNSSQELSKARKAIDALSSSRQLPEILRIVERLSPNPQLSEALKAMETLSSSQQLSEALKAAERLNPKQQLSEALKAVEGLSPNQQQLSEALKAIEKLNSNQKLSGFLKTIEKLNINQQLPEFLKLIESASSEAQWSAVSKAANEQDDFSFSRNTKTLERLLRREQELDALRAEYVQREQRIHTDIAEREKALQEREDSLRLAAKESEARFAKLEVEMQREKSLRSIEHAKAIDDLIKQRAQFEADFQKKIEAKSGQYVEETLSSLSASQRAFYWVSIAWASLGLVALLAALVFVSLLSRSASAEIISNKDVGWLLVSFSVAKGALLLGITYTVVRFCSTFSRAYMHESLKSAERKHAISYGKFYLSVYGADSDWDKLKEAFAQWNISGSSAFSERNLKSEDALQKDVPGLLVGVLTQLKEAASLVNKKPT